MKWAELKQASLETVTEWAEGQPWCQAMADCARMRNGIPRAMSGPIPRWWFGNSLILKIGVR